MAAPLTGSIPPGLDLGAAYIVQFTALNPTTGAVVSNVQVTSAAILVGGVGAAPVGNGGGSDGGVFIPLDPLWISIPNEDVSA